jgi:hypothetical protein
MAAHNLATLNPDYEIMKRPVDKALRVSYLKDVPGLAAKALDAASAAGHGVADAAKKTASLASDAATAAGHGVADAAKKTASLASDAATAAGHGVADAAKKTASLASDAATAARQGVVVAAEKTTSMASDGAESIAEAWDKHAPTKEAVVGGLVVGGVGSLVLNRDEIEVVGARTLAAASKAASAVADAAGKAATAVKEHPGAAIAGAVVGIGAVAAAPITGGGSVIAGVTLAESLAGAGGIAAAAAAVGGGAGTAISDLATKRIGRAAYREGLEKGKADSAAKIMELSDTLVQAAKVYAGQARLNEFILSLATVGFAIAACDAPVTEEERACVEEYIIGISKIGLPQETHDRLCEISDSPPGFEKAILCVQNFDRRIWLPIDGLLQIVSEADGDINEHEREFLSKWEAYKIAASEGGRTE